MALLTPCDQPGDILSIKTNKDLLLYALDLQYYLTTCAAKVDSVRKYYMEVNNDFDKRTNRTLQK